MPTRMLALHHSPTRLPLNWWDERRSAEYRSTQPLLLTYGRIISGGQKPPSRQGEKKEAGPAQVFAADSASVGHTTAPIVPKEGLQVCVALLVRFVWLERQL